LRKLGILRRVGVVPMIEANAKTFERFVTPGSDLGNVFLRGNASFFGRNHDRGTVRIIGADKLHLVALASHKTHPDIGLNVFHDVTDMEGCVGVGKSSGDKNFARCGHGIDAEKKREGPDKGHLKT
jgi:hypothetical protein